MGKCPRQIKREREAKLKGNVNERENVKSVVKAIVSEAKAKRSHGNSSGGGHIPSAKHVGGAVERVAFSADGTRAPHMGRAFEGTERYDNPGPGANRPLDRYRAPSLTVVKAPVRPEIEPDYGRRGKGAPAVRAPEVSVDAEIARRNAYARRGDYAGEGPALLPLPKIEVIEPYPRPEVSRAAYLKGPGLSVIELETPTNGAPVFRVGPLKGRPLVEPRVFKIDRLKGRRYARVRIPVRYGFPALTLNTWVPVIHRETRYHPGYDTSAWTRVRSAEELVYRALVML